MTAAADAALTVFAAELDELPPDEREELCRTARGN